VITIDKDVPVPSRCGAMTKYPFKDMEVGDSFFVPNKKSMEITPAITQFKRSSKGQYFGWTFACRKVQEEGVTGVRVWRTV